MPGVPTQTFPGYLSVQVCAYECMCARVRVCACVCMCVCARVVYVGGGGFRNDEGLLDALSLYLCRFISAIRPYDDWLICGKRLAREVCHALQVPAIHCNTLQHTAMHCNALQRTATHCNVLQHTPQSKTRHLASVFSYIYV